MPKIHGRNSSLAVWDTAGASQPITGDIMNVTLSWPRNNPDITTLGNSTTQRLDGLRDVSIKGAGIWNTGTNNAPCVLGGIMAGSLISLVKWWPAGSANTGCMFWTACMILSSYEENTGVNQAVGMAFEFQQASVSVSASTT